MSWRLAQPGHRPANCTIQAAGIQHHARKTTAERVAGCSIALGRLLIVAALIALAAWVLIR